ncbi:hypothetical protein QJS10_CPB21g00535 [Acorus calamus]|uniref:RNA polymerase II transcription factor B subunit 2 n=1 Tax=Acorus calamus TaxID=4465 RepID=A0AAV9C6I9_ACOCL|nr:hypothetical protein QJS10_CPB21g00535 [Acorus calamus]
MPQVRILAKNFMDMVAALPATKLDKLYENPFICEAVLRSLPPLAKKYALQLLFIDSPISAKTMEGWVLADGTSKHRVAIDRLLQLRVFLEEIDRKKESTYKLNPKFQGNIQKYLVYGGSLPRQPMPSNVTVRLPTLEDLETYALEQWELMDTNAQLWYIIREYISTAEDRGVEQMDLISFLLELSFHTMGEGRKESWFIPTKLATNLSVSLSDSSARKQKFEALSSLWAEWQRSGTKGIEYQLPNLIVGAITKERSLRNQSQAIGLSLNYDVDTSDIEENAHPRVAERIPAVPENVTDQIRLWENDRNRVEMTLAHVYEDFPSKEVFEATCDFARDMGGLLWEDTDKKRLVVWGEYHQDMKDFLRRQK